MRARDSFVIFVGALLAAGVALATEATTPAPGKQLTAGTASAASSAARPSGTRAGERKHMQLTKAQILALQNALAKSGDYKGKMDGVLGKETRAALHRYQHANQLQVTGWPDEATLARLGVQFKNLPADQISNRPSTSPSTPR